MNGVGKKFANAIITALKFSLILVLTGTLLFANTAVAQREIPKSVSAKEEIIYVNLNAAGQLQGVYVVNKLFPEHGAALDYGHYESIRNMTTNDAIYSQGETLVIETDADTVYYEGIMNPAQVNLPWDITVDYTLNSNPVSADELAHESGHVCIRLAVRRNPEANPSFYENYSLQISVQLDTKLCKNIKAQNATQANVGDMRQLTFICLPNKEADYLIECDAVDFTMDAISINGLRMSMEVEVDKSGINSQLGLISNAALDFDDGARELLRGANALSDGAETFYSGAYALTNGAGELNSGLEEFNGAILNMKEGLSVLKSGSSELVGGSGTVMVALDAIDKELDELSVDGSRMNELTAASNEILSGIGELEEGLYLMREATSYEAFKSTLLENGLDIDDVKAGNDTALETLQQLSSLLTEQEAFISGLGGLGDALLPYLDQAKETLLELELLMTGNNAVIYGTQLYLDGLGEGMDELYAGVDALNRGYSEFDLGLNALVEALSGVMDGFNELKAALSVLSAEYKRLDSGINDYTGGVDMLFGGMGDLSEAMLYILSGSSAIHDGNKELLAGANALKGGLDGLSAGISRLKLGTSEFRARTASMDEDVNAMIDDMIKSVTGEGDAVVSFVSERNESVELVQFVLSVEGVNAQEEVLKEEPPEEDLNFWQRLLKLFGIE